MKLIPQVRGGGCYASEDGSQIIVRRRALINCPRRHEIWANGFRQICSGNQPHFEEWWEVYDVSQAPSFTAQNLRDIRIALLTPEERRDRYGDHCTLVNPLCPEDLCVLKYGHPGTPRREHLLGTMYGSADLDGKCRERMSRDMFMAPEGTPINRLVQMGADKRAARQRDSGGTAQGRRASRARRS